MKNLRTILLVIATVVLSPSMVWAGPCDATFNFDGNLSDSSGNGNDGTMIGKGGAPAKPVYVEGRSGQALRFDGTSAMRAPLDLYISNCPQVTISAWIKIDADSPKFTQALISTGSGSGPGIRVSGTGLSLNGPANGLFKTNAIRPGSGWRFVAGVYDYEAGTFALHWQDRPLKVVPMSSNVREWEDMLWIGAMNDSLSPAATGIVIDDVRIEGKAADFEELRSLRTQIPARAPGTEGVFAGNAPTIGNRDPAQIPGDHFEPTQIPGDHFEPNVGDSAATQPVGVVGAAGVVGKDAAMVRPKVLGDDAKPDIGDSATTEVEQMSVRSHQVPMPESDSGIPPAATSANTSPGGEVGLSDSESARLQTAADESALLELGYDSEEEGIAAAEAAAQERAEAAAAAAESQESPQVGGIPRPSGEPVFSAVSGYSGSIIRTADLASVFLDEVLWRENSDRPCSMRLQGWAAGDRSHTGYEGASCNPLLRRWDYKVLASPRLTKAITRIQVCNNDRDNHRMKGLTVWGSQINSDGTTAYVPNSDSDEGPNCANWSTSVLCPGGTVGTGLVVHATQAGGDREQIVGLQLICRSITLQ